jgi:hypothetical protein
MMRGLPIPITARAAYVTERNAHGGFRIAGLHTYFITQDPTFPACCRTRLHSSRVG